MNFLRILITGFILLVSSIFLAVAMGAFFAPGEVMQYLSLQPVSDSAFNSIRSYYGGLNLAFAGFLFYAGFRMQKTALGFISLYTIGFLIGRVYSFFAEGVASAFVIRWTVVETILFVISFLLIRALLKTPEQAGTSKIEVQSQA
ncbi:DUF4345 domain-containing protein [Roseivirga spongicola]|jgi:hypothetical protein|uniref:DUF4345 domain-containing protein n=1 Tax=Roseivirga spongicola TaxID=333140 RepID=UPI000D7A5816|nr:DUF4345 domain-containing protein [Roseivirga spongicola]PWL30076.1 MAG: hypothetical protein DCO95_09595 [Roseivirga sp. XM-24bin3]WPZ11183.1 DUF4345 domain-containing protein [Roseivirga spongicola]